MGPSPRVQKGGLSMISFRSDDNIVCFRLAEFGSSVKAVDHTPLEWQKREPRLLDGVASSTYSSDILERVPKQLIQRYKT